MSARSAAPKGGAPESLDNVLTKAMAHPLRVQILAALDVEDAAPVTLAKMLGKPLGNVAYHTRVLLALGCVEAVDKTLVRGATKTTYRSIVTMLLDGSAWDELSPAAKRSITGAGLRAIFQKADAAVRAQTFDARPQRALLDVTLEMDEDAMSELTAGMTELFERAYALSKASEQRSGEGDGRFPVTVGMLAFESPNP